MNGEELAWMPAFELASLVRKRRISPVEIMEAVLLSTPVGFQASVAE